MSKALKYMSDIIKETEKEYEDALQNGMDKYAHACVTDIVRKFKNRLQVAKLIEKEEQGVPKR